MLQCEYEFGVFSGGLRNFIAWGQIDKVGANASDAPPPWDHP